jgi:hypothetical protein
MHAHTIPGRLSLLAPLFLSFTTQLPWIAAISLLGVRSASATTILASAGSLGKANDTTPGTYTWSYNPPAAGSGITFTAGVDSEDSKNNPDPAVTLGKDNYFGPGNAPQPAVVFGPVNYGGPGPANSIATNSATLKSNVVAVAGAAPHTNYTADWSVTATGTLGNGAGNRNWHSFTQAQDPWNLDASDFSGITGPTYALYFMSGIDSASISPNGTFDLDVYYQTADFTMDLLNVGGGVGGVTVSVNPYPGLQIYELTSENEGAADITGSPLTAGQIQNLFQGVADTGKLTSPVLFGFIVDGLNVPTQDMGAGVLAAMNSDVSVSDSASNTNPSTPEPGAFLLIGSGLVALAFIRRRRRT